jgi:PAS domain S-box-containing protein
MTISGWNKIQSRYYFVMVLVIGALLFSTFSLVIYRHYQDSENLNEWAMADADTIREGRLLLFNLLNMETGIRGYLLTGRKEFLEPYNASQRQIPDEINKLRPVLARSMDPLDSMSDWLGKIDNFQNTLRQQLDTYDRGGKDTFSVATLELQKTQMDGLRATLEGYITRHLNELDAKNAEAKHEQRNFALILFLGTVLAIFAMALAVFSILALMARAERARAAVAESEERFRIVMNGINDGVYDFYPADNKLYLSQGLKSMLGYSDAEFPSTIESFNALVHPDDLPDFWETVQQYSKREMNEYRNLFRMLHRHGDWRWILARGVGFWDYNGGMKRLTGTHMDITEQKKREEDLVQVNTELETFTYVASHDLRSPLVNLKGFSKELADGLVMVRAAVEDVQPSMTAENRELLQRSLEQDIPEALGFIEKATDRMDRLTTAVLDLSRIGKREYHIEKVDVDALIKKCLAAQGYEINRTQTTVDCGSLPSIHSDALALEQIFANLIDNAVKYLDPERPGRIEISAEDRATEIIYTIKDNGRGIDEADQKKIFEMFRRARNTGDVRGSGMGMSFVRATLRRLGGTIWCESAPGVGSVFHVKIPKRMQKGLAA